MGAWSHEPFGNDTANDWAYGLEGTADFAHVEAAIDAVIECGDDYLDSDNASEAIAAAEVLAHALGRGTQSDAYTEKVDAWLRTVSARPGDELLSKARNALRRVLAADSELNELWEESGEHESWRSSVDALLVAIAA